MPVEFACPSCGAPIPFRSSVSVYAVCASCGSTVLRTDRDVSLIGTAAELPAEISPLQVGTGFTLDGVAHMLVGRVRMAWEDGAWTEWFADGGPRPCWLTEAQGLYAVSFEEAVPASLLRDLPYLGDVVQVGGRAFRVSDVKRATCRGSEGELPFAAPRGRTALYLDMLGDGGGFAGLEESAEGRRLYVGSYREFDALGFTTLREVEGWTPPRPVAPEQPSP